MGLIDLAIFLLQYGEETKIKRTQRAGSNAGRRTAGGQFIPAKIAFPCLSGFLVILRRTIGATFYTYAAAHALRLINNNNTVLGLFLNGPYRAIRDAYRFLAVIAAD